MNNTNDSNNEKPSSNKLTEEELLNIAMKIGNKPHISVQRIDANRWQLKRKLNAKSLNKSFILGLLHFVFTTNRLQVIGMCLTFTLGFLIASNNGISQLAFNEEQVQASNNKSINSRYIQDKDQIIDLVIGKSEGSSNLLNIQYTTLRQTKIKTSVENKETLNILTDALKNNLSDATRLDLIDFLKGHLGNEMVRESLSYSLLNDPNPGVRMVAAESLAKLSSDKKVRSTLRQALIEDTNQGVRVSVFEGLLEQLDEKTITLFKEKGSQDGNYYIRNKTKNIIKKIQQRKEFKEQSI
jgi:hypothetical protein